MSTERMFGARSLQLNIDPFLGAGIITGASSLISGLFGSKSNYDATKETNEMNYKIAQETNANQMKIADANNQMQIAMNRENNQFNQAEAERAFQRQVDMFNRENAYNTPEAQRARYEAAGINPFLAMSGNNPAVASGGSVPAASASGSGISPSMPNLVTPTMVPPPSIAAGIANAFNSSISTIAGAYAQVAGARKNDAETVRIKTLLGDELARLKAESEKEGALAKLAKFDSQWMQRNGNMWYKSSRLEKASKEVNELISRAADEMNHANVNQQTYTNLMTEGDILAEKYEMTKTERKMLDKRLSNLQRELDDLHNESVARQNESNAAADSHHAAAALSREQIQTQVKMQKQIQEITEGQRIENWVNNKSKWSRYMNVVRDAVHAGIVSEQAQIELEKAQYARDHQAVEFWISQINNVLSPASGLALGAAALKGAGLKTRAVKAAGKAPYTAPSVGSADHSVNYTR